MYGLLDGVAATPPTQSARAVLRELMSSLGAAGLAAAAAHPRLLASVDQHAAAIRDSLVPDHDPVPDHGPANHDPVPDHEPASVAASADASVDALAGYAEGIRETAVGHGWRPPTGPVDWSTGGDWVLTRLLAVCALARPLGVEPSPAPAARPAPEHEGPSTPR